MYILIFSSFAVTFFFFSFDFCNRYMVFVHKNNNNNNYLPEYLFFLSFLSFSLSLVFFLVITNLSFLIY